MRMSELKMNADEDLQTFKKNLQNFEKIFECSSNLQEEPSELRMGSLENTL